MADALELGGADLFFVPRAHVIAHGYFAKESSSARKSFKKCAKKSCASVRSSTPPISRIECIESCAAATSAGGEAAWALKRGQPQ